MNGICFPLPTRLSCFFPCLLIWWLPLSSVSFSFKKKKKQWWNLKDHRFSNEVFYCVLWSSFVFLCTKQDFCLTSFTNSEETTPSISLDLHFHGWTGLFSIIHMVQATDVYTTKYELYTAPTWYCKCWMCFRTHAISHLIEHFQGWYHHQYILSFSIFCLPFSLLFYFFVAPCWVCMSGVLWVDVQTGCVWAGVPLSVHLSRH